MLGVLRPKNRWRLSHPLHGFRGAGRDVLPARLQPLPVDRLDLTEPAEAAGRRGPAGPVWPRCACAVRCAVRALAVPGGVRPGGRSPAANVTHACQVGFPDGRAAAVALLANPAAGLTVLGGPRPEGDAMRPGMDSAAGPKRSPHCILPRSPAEGQIHLLRCISV